MMLNGKRKGQLAGLVMFLVWQVLWAATREPREGTTWTANIGFTAIGVALGLLVSYGVASQAERNAANRSDRK